MRLVWLLQQMPIIYRHNTSRAVFALNTKYSTFTVQYQLKFEIFFRAVSRSINHAVNRRPLTAKARVHSRAGASEICGEQSGSETGFSPSTAIFTCQFRSANAQHNFIYIPVLQGLQTGSEAWSLSLMKCYYGNLEAPNCTALLTYFWRGGTQ
jgi:hypothetical protein